VETRRFLLRATNSGVTAIVDPRGIVTASAPRAALAVVGGQVAVTAAETLYMRIGDAFAWACVLVSLAALLVWRRAR
jgi:apolipoprotein N-acyltransferase